MALSLSWPFICLQNCPDLSFNLKAKSWVDPDLFLTQASLPQVAAIHSWLSHLPDPPPLSHLHPIEETPVFCPATQSDAPLNISSPLKEKEEEEEGERSWEEERARRQTKSFNLPRHCQTSSKVQTFIWGDTTHKNFMLFIVKCNSYCTSVLAFSVAGFWFVINLANKTKIHFLCCLGKTKPYVMN